MNKPKQQPEQHYSLLIEWSDAGSGLYCEFSVNGNLDCRAHWRAARSGSRLSKGGLFSVGDAAAQGDGEVSRMAIECPMERVELTFNLCSDLELEMPQADTPVG